MIVTSTFNLEGMVDPQQFIKIALRVNYELGLRIHKSKDVILDIEKNKANCELIFDFLTKKC